MTNHARFSQDRFPIRWGLLLFVGLWTGGILIGTFLSYYRYDYFVSLMRVAVVQPVSIVGLAFCVFFPFLIIAISLLCYKIWVVLLFFFCKAVSFGFCSALISAVFSSAGWLLRGLFLFSDTLNLVVLLCFYLRHYDGQLDSFLSDCRIYAVCGIGIIIVDYFWISVILQSLF